MTIQNWKTIHLPERFLYIKLYIEKTLYNQKKRNFVKIEKEASGL